MNLTKNITQNKWTGGNRMKVIVIHWWNDPAQKPTLDGVVSWFLNPKSQVSAHYVVSGDKVIQMADETDITWHAMEANSFAIGIEVDPNVPGNTYKTVGELVKQIRSRRGNLPLKRHSEYVNTTCPGNIDLDRIERESKGEEPMITNLVVDALFRMRLGRTCDPKQRKDLIRDFKTAEELDVWIKKLPEYKDKVKRAKEGKERWRDFLGTEYRTGLVEPAVEFEEVKDKLFRRK